MRQEYRKKASQFIIAVQLELETKGFEYNKWGAVQHCKPGDWLVTNGKDTYTIDQDTFEKTYRKLDSGKFIKTTTIWAEIATQDGSVVTKEGRSHYKKGDYIVSNNKDGSDGYCISEQSFNEMYEPV